MKAIFGFLPFRTKSGRYLTKRSVSYLTLLLVFLASTTLGAVPQSLTPESSTASWEIHLVDAPSYFFMLTDRTLRYDSDGVPCMAYGGDSLYFSCYDKDTDTWDTELVDANPSAGSHAALAFNDQDKPFISYYNAEDGNLMLAYKDFMGFWQTKIMDESIGSPAARVPLLEPDDLSLQAYDLPIFKTALLAPSDGDPWDDLSVPGIGKFTSIDIDNVNGIHISYYDDFSVPGGQLKYAYWDGWSFLPAITVVQSYNDQGKVGLWSSIVVDSTNHPHISYMTEKYDTLMYAKLVGSRWVTEEVQPRVAGVGTYSSIALDTEDRPHISYFDFVSRSLRHAYRKLNGDWSLSIVDSGDHVGYFTSIAVSNDNEIYISYYNASGGNLKLAHTSFGNWSSWTKKTVASEGDVGYYTSIALKNNQPSIFYFDLTTGHLKFTRWRSDTDDWKTSTLTNHYIGDVGKATSLTLSMAGAPHISYMDDSRDLLKYAQTLELNWVTSFVKDNIHAGSWSSIDLLNDLQPAIAFYDMSNRELKLAVWNGEKWEFELVDTDGDVGAYVSMKIDSAGNYHISYYDATLLRLKYAFKEKYGDEEDWVITVLDRNWVGLFTSLVLDEFDRPYISYFDARNENIKVIFKSMTDTWVDFPVANVGDPDDSELIKEAQTSIGVLGTLPNIRIHISYYNETLQDLGYVYYEAGVWNNEMLDPAPDDVGKYNSLALDPATSNRHLCYYDATNGDLKYAFWDGSWSYEVVDNAGDVGAFCSLALNSAGEPAISYYDATGHDLKYATSFPLPDVSIHHIYLPMVID